MPDEPEVTEPEGGDDAPVEEKVNRLEQGLDALRGKVDEVLHKIVGGGGPPAEVEADGSEGGDSPPKEPTSAKEIESSMEAEVRTALEKISADEKHAADHDKLAKEVERAPKQLGRVTQALWGDRD
jgi:hypothetical protein